jgi:hypothetical protein
MYWDECLYYVHFCLISICLVLFVALNSMLLKKSFSENGLNPIGVSGEGAALCYTLGCTQSLVKMAAIASSYRSVKLNTHRHLQPSSGRNAVLKRVLRCPLLRQEESTLTAAVMSSEDLQL